MDWQADEETQTLVHHVALQNALEYEGNAAVGSVIGRIMAMRGDLRQHGKADRPRSSKRRPRTPWRRTKDSMP